MLGRIGRSVVAVVIAGTALMAPATPAAADPAEPTNYRSQVLEVEPQLPGGVTLRVLGGDGFLELTVRPGHTALVPDYESGPNTARRPYLRFGPDGLVERNERSAAAVANESRFGSSANADIGPEPRWVEVADDGRYVWHDHRIHWMLPRPPEAVDAAGRVDLGGPNGTWSVDLDVDGVATTVRGELLLLDPPSPLPYYALAALVAAALLAALVLRDRRARQLPYRLLAITTSVVSAGAVLVGYVQWQSIPPDAGGNALTAAVPAVALIAAIVAAAIESPRVRLTSLAVTVAALGGWALLRNPVLSNAVLPTDLSFGVDRAVTAISLGVAVALAAVLAWRPPASRPPVRATGA